jgi:hypothetical protein
MYDLYLKAVNSSKSNVVDNEAKAKTFDTLKSKLS